MKDSYFASNLTENGIYFRELVHCNTSKLLPTFWIEVTTNGHNSCSRPRCFWLPVTESGQHFCSTKRRGKYCDRVVSVTAVWFQIFRSNPSKNGLYFCKFVHCNSSRLPPTVTTVWFQVITNGHYCCISPRCFWLSATETSQYFCSVKLS